MSGFNTIKKSRKRSYEIDEKLNVLNSELEKTKDIREIAPTMSTGGLYTPVQQSQPQDPVQVPNPDPDPTSGATTGANWTQPVGDGQDGGTAGDIPTSFPKIWNNPGYQNPTSGWFGANGEPLYSQDDLNYDIPDPSETGDVPALGAIQRATGSGVVTGYLRGDISKDSFVDTNGSLGVTFQTHPHLFQPIYYWVSFSIFNPLIDAYWPNNSLGLTPQYTGIVAGSEDNNPRALFTAYKYVGGARTQIFDPVGSRGGTTAGDPKGTGDPDQYPPLPFGPEAFDALDKMSKKKKDDDIAGLSPWQQQILQKGLDAITRQKGYEAAKREQQRLMKMYGIYFPLASNSSPYAGADDGDQFAFFGGNKNEPTKKATKKTRKGTMDATKASTGMYPDMTPEIFKQKYGISHSDYFQLNHFKPKGDLLKENAYMALLHRDYRPHEQDYVKYGAKTPEDRKLFDKKVKRVLAYAKKYPDRLEYVMKRYPKNDPRLSMLNYKMDNMMEASNEYLETQFPTNQDLFTKVKDRTKKNMNLTDPKNFKPVKDPIKYVDVKKTEKLKETVTRHFNKPVKSKSMFGLSISKVKKTNQKMIEKREQEQRIKEEDKDYIEERMSRQKSNWKDDLTSL